MASAKVYYCRDCAEQGEKDVVLIGRRGLWLHIWRHHRFRWWGWSPRNLPTNPFPLNAPKPSAEFMAFNFKQHNLLKPKPRDPTP